MMQRRPVRRGSHRAGAGFSRELLRVTITGAESTRMSARFFKIPLWLPQKVAPLYVDQTVRPPRRKSASCWNLPFST
jgi:hypothetical protein